MYVYFIKCNNIQNSLKIGKSNDPDARLKALQVSNPQFLELIEKVIFQNERQAYAVEKKLQNIFKKDKQRGEWFPMKIYEDASRLCNKYADKNRKWAEKQEAADYYGDEGVSNI